jgi:hypothetical protein
MGLAVVFDWGARQGSQQGPESRLGGQAQGAGAWPDAKVKAPGCKHSTAQHSTAQLSTVSTAKSPGLSTAQHSTAGAGGSEGAQRGVRGGRGGGGSGGPAARRCVQREVWASFHTWVDLSHLGRSCRRAGSGSERVGPGSLDSLGGGLGEGGGEGGNGGTAHGTREKGCLGLQVQSSSRP